MSKSSRPKLTRDGTLFIVGLAAFVHELLLSPSERPYILAVCVAMMGLPAFLNWDESRR